MTVGEFALFLIEPCQVGFEKSNLCNLFFALLELHNIWYDEQQLHLSMI